MPDPETVPAPPDSPEAKLAALVQHFARIESTAELYDFWQHVPYPMEQPLMAMIEERIKHAEHHGQAAFARGLRQRLATFRNLHDQQAAGSRSPTAQALIAFLQAPDESRARYIYTVRLELLHAEEGQRVLDQHLHGSNEQAEQRLAERRALLRALRQETDQLLVDFVHAGDADSLRGLVEAHPILLNAGLEPAFDSLAQRHQDDPAMVALIEDRRTLLRACRTQGAQATFESLALGVQRLAAFQAAAEDYLRMSESAEQEADGADPAAWRRAVEAGQALLADEWRNIPGVDWDALRETLASDYTALGNALQGADDHAQALAAFEQAAATQPGEALWRENLAEALIALDRLEEAGQALAAARELNADSPRLAELEATLAARHA